MGKTVQELVDVIKSNIGDRQTGNIGTRSVDVVALDSINNCLLKIAKAKKHIKEFEKKSTINVTNASYTYAMPTQDTSNVTIRVKKILRMVSIRVGEVTGVPLERIHPLRRDTIFPLTTPYITGRPTLYSCYSNILELYPFPNTNYTITARMIIWPDKLTINSTSTSLGEEFDTVFEMFGTCECFSRLQQYEDSAIWKVKFEEELKATLASLDDYPDEEWFPHGGIPLIGEMGTIGPISNYSRAYNSALGIA